MPEPRTSGGRSRPGAVWLSGAALVFAELPGTERREVLASVGWLGLV